MPKYILLDTETTGAGERDRIIQLGYLVLEGRDIEVHNEFCSSEIPISYGAMEVHGITPEMIENKPKCTDLSSYKRLLELNTPKNFLIIHNAPFDLEMLQKEGFENKMQLIDTLRVAKHLLPDEEAHRLQYFRYKMGLYKLEDSEAKKLGIEVKAHNAIGDVLVLKLLLSELRKLIIQKYPDQESVAKMVELTQTPIFIEKFRFGKYKDKTLKEVAIQDRGYLEWMLNKMENLDDDLRYSIEKVLQEVS
ncbi:DNA polymerase III epsilon subunit [hydrothermal vent metagenome]|uniref:DNA polymerase III epsilon subunit n=1 Tax=hydrothermal vent metagenome TaxID=652676 RepID=A0A1W1BYN3_9ZZZZ